MNILLRISRWWERFIAANTYLMLFRPLEAKSIKLFYYLGDGTVRFTCNDKSFDLQKFVNNAIDKWDELFLTFIDSMVTSREGAETLEKLNIESDSDKIKRVALITFHEDYDDMFAINDSYMFESFALVLALEIMMIARFDAWNVPNVLRALWLKARFEECAEKIKEDYQR